MDQDGTRCAFGVDVSCAVLLGSRVYTAPDSHRFVHVCGVGGCGCSCGGVLVVGCSFVAVAAVAVAAVVFVVVVVVVIHVHIELITTHLLTPHPSLSRPPSLPIQDLPCIERILVPQHHRRR